MRDPIVVDPGSIEEVPDCPAVFLLWASAGTPYLARTALLRRRLKRLLSQPERISRLLNLQGVATRVEYWHTGSQIDSALVYLELAKRYFPDDWRRVARVKPPHFVRLTLENEFPRTLISTRLGRGISVGPMASRATAERFENGVLDLFQIRRCEENLAPSPEHPGCIYGEMGRCLRPCQQIVGVEEYRSEVGRLQAFLETEGASLLDSAESARDRASDEMQFEEAARLHARVDRIKEVRGLAGELARPLDRLWGVAVVPSADPAGLDLLVLAGGAWCGPLKVPVSDTSGAGLSLDRRLREIASGVVDAGPNLDHLGILQRWHSSSWRDGEWIPFEAPGKFPYRRIVNAVGRLASRRSAPSL